MMSDATERARSIRFDTFLREHDVRGRSLLELGGGDFRQHLADRAIECQCAVIDRDRLVAWEPERRFDYVVSFTADPSPAELSRRAFERCTVAAYVTIAAPLRAAEALTLGLDITPFVVLRHHYLANEFSVALYRNLVIDTRPDLLLADEA